MNAQGIMTVGAGILIATMTVSEIEIEICLATMIQGVVGGQGHDHENVLGIMIATGSFSKFSGFLFSQHSLLELYFVKAFNTT